MFPASRDRGRHLRVCWASCFVALVWADLGCSFDAAVPEGSRISCKSDEDCPPSFTCSSQGCLRPGVSIPIVPVQSFSTNEDVPLLFALDAGEVRRPRFVVVEPPTLGDLSCEGGAPCARCDEEPCLLAEETRYTPQADRNGTDTFVVRLQDLTVSGSADGPLASDPAVITIAVTPVNDAPTFDPSLAMALDEDDIGALNLLRVAHDVDNADVTLTVSESPAHGDVLISDGVAQYRPFIDTHGADRFSVRAEDSDGGSAEAAVDVLVRSVNDAPRLADVEVSTAEGVPVRIDVPASDASDPEDSLTLQVGAFDADDALVTVDGLAVEVTPLRRGADLLVPVSARDDGAPPLDSEERALIVHVGVDLKAQPTEALAVEDLPTSFVLHGLAKTPFAAFEIDSSQTRGTVSVAAATMDDDGSDLDPDNDFRWSAAVTYQTAPDDTGDDQVVFTLRDANGQSSTEAIAHITVTPVNDTPELQDVELFTDEATPLAFSAPGSDPRDPGDRLTVLIGDYDDTAAEVVSDGLDVIVTPLRRGGTIVLPMTVVDDGTPQRESVERTATIHVGVDLRALPATHPVQEDSEATFLVQGFSDAPFVTMELDPAGLRGSVSVGPATLEDDGSDDDPDNDFRWSAVARYLAAPDDTGDDTFRFRLRDASGAPSADASVVMSVGAQNDPPTVAIACGCQPEVGEGVVAGVLIEFTLADADDPLGSAPAERPLLEVRQQGARGNASVEDAAAGLLRYVPAPGQRGDDEIVVRAVDPHGGTSADLPVSVHIRAELLARDATVQVTEDVPTVFNLLAVSEHPVSFSLLTVPSEGALEEVGVSAPGAAPGETIRPVRYTPPLDGTEPQSFQFLVIDLVTDEPSVGEVHIEIVPSADAPVARDMGPLFLDEDQPNFAVDLAPLVSDVDDDALTVEIVLPAARGAVFLDDTLASYVPDPDTHGPDEFHYVVRDGGGREGIGVVRLEVRPIEDPPVAAPITVTTEEDTPVFLELQGTDVDGDDLTFQVTPPPGFQMIFFSPSVGVALLQPPSNETGTREVTFSVDDGALTDSATATVVLTAVNDPPALVTTSVLYDVNLASVRFTLAATDPDGDAVTISRVLRAPALASSFSTAGLTANYATAQRILAFSVNDSFKVELSDGAGGKAPAEVTVRLASRPSCEAIAALGVPVSDGIYVLDPGAPGDNPDEPGRHLAFCAMDPGPMRGATLVLKSGSSEVWKHGAASWFDDRLINATQPGLVPGAGDAKPAAYALVAGTELIVQVATPAGLRALRMRTGLAPATLRALVDAGPLPLGEHSAATWAWLLGAPQRQEIQLGPCATATHGINLEQDGNRVRIGVAFNPDDGEGCSGAAGVGLSAFGSGASTPEQAPMPMSVAVFIKGGEPTSTCGDAIVDDGEECDDGLNGAGDGCDACALERCGDGRINNVFETCDDGNDDASDGCDACQALCGDSLLVPPPIGFEQCDDGNTSDDDGCDSNCTPTGCGNGLCVGSEACAVCPADCGSCIECGDSLCDASESCDSCAQDCGACIVCGDGICNGAEDCSSCGSDCGLCPACGDGACTPASGETCETCQADCGVCPFCGDAFCADDETCDSCSIDCGACPFCGDLQCNDGENCESCSGDCGVCICGNGRCDSSEDCTSCSGDCGSCLCGDAVCNGTETCGSCSSDCGSCPPVCGDASCDGGETCADCSQDCGACPACGDSTCNGDETCAICPGDCGACPPVCADGQCTGDETCATCEQDCGPCPTCGDGVCNGDDTCDTCPDDCAPC